jgi:hypothetical protein
MGLWETVVRADTRIVNEGFQTLWKRIASTYRDLWDIQYNTEVVEIKAGCTPPAITTQQDHTRQSRQFDLVINTLPLGSIKTPLPDELTKGAWRQTIWSFVVTIKRTPKSDAILNDNPIAYVLDASTLLNSVACVRLWKYDHPNPSNTTDVLWVLSQSTPAAAGAFDQAGSKQGRAKLVINELVQIFGDFSSGADRTAGMKVCHEKRCIYNVHWSPRQLAQGVPQKVDRLQGLDGVWFSGGQLSHWNVESILQASIALVSRIMHSSNLRGFVSDAEKARALYLHQQFPRSKFTPM